MARYAYDRLTALDNSFLVLERPNAYMHVASTQTFEAGPLAREGGGIDAQKIKELIGSCLHMIPRYRQKLQWIPFSNSPIWVDDPRFKLDYHVRHTSLPRPGSDEQLKLLSARIMEQHLDRRRPLWEMWVVEGLDGDRFALISKVHHCMIDGMSGIDLMKVLMSMTPEHFIHDSPSYIPRPAPSALELLQDEVWRWAKLPFSAANGLTQVVSEMTNARRALITGLRSVAETLGGSLAPASATPLNGEIGPHRRFDWLVMELEDIKEVRRAFDGSLNDVVLTVVTGAVRRFLQRRQVRPSQVDFKIMAPVSIRSDDQAGTLGNRITAWLLELPIHEEDPFRQFEAINKRTSELKSSRNPVSAEMLTQVAEWTPSTVLSLAARNASRLLPFNMVVTNVPGPQFPMYMLGAKMQEVYPHVPLADSLGLGIALMSYDGKLCWGFNADYDLIPDLPAFLDCISDAFTELQKLAHLRRAARESSRAVNIEPPKTAEAPQSTAGNGATAAKAAVAADQGAGGQESEDVSAQSSTLRH